MSSASSTQVTSDASTQPQNQTIVHSTQPTRTLDTSSNNNDNTGAHSINVDDEQGQWEQQKQITQQQQNNQDTTGGVKNNNGATKDYDNSNTYQQGGASNIANNAPPPAQLSFVTDSQNPVLFRFFDSTGDLLEKLSTGQIQINSMQDLYQFLSPQQQALFATNGVDMQLFLDQMKSLSDNAQTLWNGYLPLQLNYENWVQTTNIHNGESYKGAMENHPMTNITNNYYNTYNEYTSVGATLSNEQGTGHEQEDIYDTYENAGWDAVETGAAFLGPEAEMIALAGHGINSLVDDVQGFITGDRHWIQRQIGNEANELYKDFVNSDFGKQVTSDGEKITNWIKNEATDLWNWL